MMPGALGIEKRKRSFISLVPWIFAILVIAYFVISPMKTKDIKQIGPSPTPEIPPESKFDWSSIEWKKNPDLIDATYKSFDIKFLGKFIDSVSNSYKIPLTSGVLQYSEIDNCHYYYTGHFEVNKLHYPQSHADLEDNPPPIPISFDNYGKCIPIYIPSMTITASMMYTLTRLASIPHEYFKTYTVVLNKHVNGINEVLDHFGVTQDRIVYTQNAISATKMVIVQYPQSGQHYFSSLSYLVNSLKGILNPKMYSNSITLIDDCDKRITNFPEVKTLLAEKNDRVISLKPGSSFLDNVHIFYRSHVIICFMSEKIRLVPFIQPGKCLILIHHHGDFLEYPLISAKFGIKVYVIGVNSFTISENVIECIHKIAEKEYPNEDKPQQGDDEEADIVLSD